MRTRTRRRVTLRGVLLLGLLALATSAAVLTTTAAAADVTVHATLDRAQLAVGDTADLSVVVEGAQDVPAPELGDLNGVSVRYVGPSSQLSIVNGRTSSSITHHFSITVMKAGTFTIGPIEVEHDGKRYSAGIVNVRAVAGQPGRAAAPGGGPGSDQLRLVLTSPRARAYLHERVPLTLTLTVGAVQVADVHYPTIPGDGFAIEPLRDPQQRREQTAQGMVQVVEFPTMLTPLRAGSLTIGPATLELSVPVRGRGRDPFLDRFLGGDPFGGRRPITLQSEAVQLEVLPLPEAGKPADFTGAVGRFQLQVDAAPRQLTAGDPVTVTTTIQGDGNLEGIQPPSIAESDALKVYPVQTAGGAARTPAPNAASTGARVAFEQVVIPQQAGTVTLPPPRFSYFDPTDGAYRTATAPPIALTVKASTQPAAQPPVGAAAPGTRRVEPETLGRDIVFIKDTPGKLAPIGTRRYRSALFWTLQVVPFALWALFGVYDRRRRRLHADPRLARFSAAGRSARRAIADAEATLRAGDRAKFYDRLASTMRDYLSAKLDLPPGAVTAESVVTRVRAHGVSAEVADGLREFFATCEQARFAPGGNAEGDMRQTLERAESLLRAMERERRAPVSWAAALVAIVTLTAAVLGTAALVAGRLEIASTSHAANAPESAPARSETPNTIFFRANALYADEHYPEAAAEYERILQAGLESGPLYFNLGNAYFKTGDVGHAVLAYERARRLIPGDPDLRANLRFARSETADDDASLVGQLLFPLAQRASSDTLLLAASLLYAAVMLLLIVRSLAPTVERVATRTALAVALLFVVVGASASYRLVTVDVPSYAVVTAADGATIRFEPSSTGTAHFEAKSGSVLRVLATREQWTQVVRPDGKRGWIAADSVAPL